MVRIQVDDVKLGDIERFSTINSRDQARKLLVKAEGFSHSSGGVDNDFLKTDSLEIVNPLVQAFYLSFAHHLPLHLSPDIIFNTIMQSVSTHVGKYSEKYRDVFVAHGGKKELVYRNDNLEKGNWGNAWAGMVDDLSSQIMSNLEGDEAKKVLVTTFTTTAQAEATAHKGVFMDVVKHYFDYTCMSLCGIPFIEILGTKEDWQQIKDVVSPLLAKLNLQVWCTDLNLILDQFVAAFEGDSDKGFWSRSYKYVGPSGSGGVASLSGWVANLFLDSSLKYGQNRSIGNIPKLLADINESANVPHGSYHAIPLANFPQGLTSTQFQWLYHDKSFDMALSSGLIGVVKTNDGALKPELGWVISEAAEDDDQPHNRITIKEAMKIWDKSDCFAPDCEKISKKNFNHWQTDEDIWNNSPMFS